MSRFAQSGNTVLFIENTGARAPGIHDISRISSRIKNWRSGVSGIREISKNLYVFSPLILPFPYMRIANWINQHIMLSTLKKCMRLVDFTNPVIWIFLPTPLSLKLIEYFNSKLVVYYCIDNFRVSSSSVKKIRNSEILLLKKADLVFVTSQALFDYCLGYNTNIHYFPFAVNYDTFEKIRLTADSDTPQDLVGIKHPIIGYVGGVHKWIDFALIKEAALKYPQYSFVLVGPLQTDTRMLKGINNIFFLGKKEHQRVPYLISNFDVCIIPYLITAYTVNVYPTKLNEYLALGKPVVSTELPEVVRFNKENDNPVMIGRDKKGFLGLLGKAAKEKDTSLVEKCIRAAKRNSWDTRIEEMSALMEASLRKKRDEPFDWKSSFLNIYKSGKRKGFNIGFVFLCLYLLIFYTHLCWLVAEPLAISQAPKKANCILVFAGGVGESGKAGQGFEERVKYSVELYKKGFAKYIIFSSGYMYTFKEPLVMKAVAVELGVPQEAIILEDKASGTYENVKFSGDILRKHGWHNVILVSSLYHMRRASLVFNKLCKDIKVTYVPVEYGIFYSHPEKDELGRKIWKRINIEQIRGILHEYLAIIYYWHKGWA